VAQMEKIICFVLFVFCFSFNVSAQYFYTPQLLAPYIENAPNIISRAAVLVDAETGTLLYWKNGDDQIPPASLTKLMTMHLIMKEIEEGRASYDELVPVTEASWAQRQPPRSSLMFLEPGQIVTLREILLGLAVSSGNDASVAAALRLAPDMDAFARLMTLQAREMGLTVTRFVESSGYSNENMTTANEFTFFCYQYIKMHPDSLRDFHSVQSFSYPLAVNVPERRRYNFQTVTQSSNNTLLRTFPGVDGLKTGFIPDSGYNIALTAERENTRFVLVLLGAPSEPRVGARIRAQDSTRILTWAFENFKTVRPDNGERVTENKGQKAERGADNQIKIYDGFLKNIKLWKGRENSVEIKLAASAVFTSPADRANTLSYETVVMGNLTAPLLQDHPIGYLVINDEYGELNRVPLLTVKAYERGNIFKRIWHSILLLFKR